MSNPNYVDHKGYMTVREVLQLVGTDMFRDLNPSVWIDSCLRQIEEDQSEVALISDVRFENEVKAIQKQKGFVIGLARTSNTKENDTHISEQEPQKCLNLCDIVIDNKNLSIPEQNKEIYFAIKHLDNMANIVGD